MFKKFKCFFISKKIGHRDEQIAQQCLHLLGLLAQQISIGSEVLENRQRVQQHSQTIDSIPTEKPKVVTVVPPSYHSSDSRFAIAGNTTILSNRNDASCRTTTGGASRFPLDLVQDTNVAGLRSERSCETGY